MLSCGGESAYMYCKSCMVSLSLQAAVDATDANEKIKYASF